MVAGRRAISTVMDVSLALLIISASIIMIGLYLESDAESIDGDRGHETLQSVSGSTITITYDLSEPNEHGHAATDDENYDEPELIEDAEVSELHEITTYGSATDLLTEATLTNLRNNGTELFAYQHAVGNAVEGAIKSQLVGSDGRVHAVASWEPYDGATITGNATVGTPPDSTVDISSGSETYASGLPAPSPEELADAYVQGEEASPVYDGFDMVAEELAAHIVEGYFPEQQTQYALESSLTESAKTRYKYRQLADEVDVDLEDAITGTDANAATANQILIEGDTADLDGLAGLISADIRTTPAGEEIAQTYDAHGDGAELEETFEDVVSIETVDVTVQTWTNE